MLTDNNLCSPEGNSMKTPRLFALFMPGEMDTAVFEHLSSFVREDSRERINGIKNRRSAQRSLVGELLAKVALNRVLSLPPDKLVFARGRYGKPYLANCPEAHFNISHSGDYIVCAVFDAPVGIDIQKTEEIDFSGVAKRAFTPAEAEVFALAPKGEEKRAFYEIWTKKESHIKFLGTGARDLRKEPDSRLIFDTCTLNDDYILSVCYMPQDNNRGFAEN